MKQRTIKKQTHKKRTITIIVVLVLFLKLRINTFGKTKNI